jgi:replicative DNA helicase
VPSAGNIRRYAEIVRERSILRKLVSASDEIATNAFNPQGAAGRGHRGRGRTEDLQHR